MYVLFFDFYRRRQKRPQPDTGVRTCETAPKGLDPLITPPVCVVDSLSICLVRLLHSNLRCRTQSQNDMMHSEIENYPIWKGNARLGRPQPDTGVRTCETAPKGLDPLITPPVCVVESVYFTAISDAEPNHKTT
jgi:hypothetical protein